MNSKNILNSMNLSTLDWPEILERICSYATSGSAREILQKTSSLANSELALQSFREIEDATLITSGGQRPFMESLDIFFPWMSRLKKNAVLKNLELKDVRHFCHEVLALKEILDSVSSDWTRSQSERLMVITEPLSAIDQILTPSGDIRSDASERLYSLTRDKEKLTRELQSTLDHLVKDHQFDSMLQEKYVTTREGRWVLPVKSGMQTFFPGVIHGSSQTKQTVFLEPEKIIPINNRLRQIEVDIEEEIERLLTDLSSYLSRVAPELSSTRDILEECDVRLAQAQFTTMVKAKPVQFSDNTLDLMDLRHPVLELGSKPVIPNNVHLTPDHSILLLSGPNAGGKTVLLKSIGLAAQMARCGLPICAAETSRLPFFKNVLICIGDAQSVDQEMSTFAAHLKRLDEASKLQGPLNLILVDEICGSTDPEEGSAIARSFIEAFSERDLMGIVTSHLGPLKSGWSETSKVLNGCMEYDSNSGRPTYCFVAGIPGDSLAIQTAKRVGVNPTIVARALDYLSPQTRERLSGLEQIEKMRQDVHMLQDHLKKETQKAASERQKYERLLKQFEAEKDTQLKKSLHKAEKKIEEAIAATKVDQSFQRHKSLQEIKFNLPEIIQAKSVTTPTGFESVETFAKKFPAGTKVYVPSLQQDGIIQSAPNSKGEVVILSNSLRLQLPWTELRIAEKPHNPTSQIVRERTGIGLAPTDIDTVLDVRGKTVQEAQEDLEEALDRAIRHRDSRLKIIHGHGTETLKKAVRTYLSRSVYVKKWKAGSPETGGDGMTWVELNLD